MPESVSAIARLEAIDAIRTLITTYCWHVDRVGFANVDGASWTESFTALFAEDASMVITDGIFKGRDATVGWYLDAGLIGPRTFSRHIPYNQLIEITGPNTATHDAQWMAFGVVGDSSTLRFGGYHDEFIKVDGRWLFKVKGNETYLTTDHASGWAHLEEASSIF